MKLLSPNVVGLLFYLLKKQPIWHQCFWEHCKCCLMKKEEEVAI
jgi:hypothetical protein